MGVSAQQTCVGRRLRACLRLSDCYWQQWSRTRQIGSSQILPFRVYSDSTRIHARNVMQNLVGRLDTAPIVYNSKPCLTRYNRAATQEDAGELHTAFHLTRKLYTDDSAAGSNSVHCYKVRDEEPMSCALVLLRSVMSLDRVVRWTSGSLQRPRPAPTQTSLSTKMPVCLGFVIHSSPSYAAYDCKCTSYSRRSTPACWNQSGFRYLFLGFETEERYGEIC